MFVSFQVCLSALKNCHPALASHSHLALYSTLVLYSPRWGCSRWRFFWSFQVFLPATWCKMQWLVRSVYGVCAPINRFWSRACQQIVISVVHLWHRECGLDILHFSSPCIYDTEISSRMWVRYTSLFTPSFLDICVRVSTTTSSVLHPWLARSRLVDTTRGLQYTITDIQVSFLLHHCNTSCQHSPLYNVESTCACTQPDVGARFCLLANKLACQSLRSHVSWSWIEIVQKCHRSHQFK